MKVTKNSLRTSQALNHLQKMEGMVMEVKVQRKRRRKESDLILDKFTRLKEDLLLLN